MQIPKWFMGVIAGASAILGMIVGVVATSYSAGEVVTKLTMEVAALRESMTDTVKPAIAKVAEHDIRIAILEHRPAPAVSVP